MILRQKPSLSFFMSFDIIFKFINFFKFNRSNTTSIYLYMYNILMLLRLFIFSLFNCNYIFISKNFTLSLYKYTNKFNFFKNKSFLLLYKYFLFKHLKYIMIIHFFFFRKNLKNIFFLNFYTNFSNFFISIKNNFSLISENINFIKNKKNTWLTNSLMNLKSNNNVIFNILKNLSNFNNFFGLINKVMTSNFIFSYYFLWKFIFFLPFSNFFFSVYSSNYNFWNLLKLDNTRKNLNKCNLSIFKYFNIVNYNPKEFSRSVLFHFMQLRRKIYNFIEDSQFSDILVRFINSISKMKTAVCINKSLYDQLTFTEWLKFDLLRRRFKSSVRFRHLRLTTKFLQQPVYKAFGRNPSMDFYWFEITLVCFLSFKLKDTTLLITYLYNKMRVMSLFNHRSFLRRIFYILRILYSEIGSWYGIIGVKIKVSGKISVTGNSRTRTIHFKEGLVSNSNMNIRVDYNYTIIKTNTGCLGLSLWLFY